jgi:hypothetical protein
VEGAASVVVVNVLENPAELSKVVFAFYFVDFSAFDICGGVHGVICGLFL